MNNTDLYFRGERNTISIVEMLRKDYKLNEAETIMVSGCSAGGLAAFTWANYFEELFPNKVKV